jgi:hypothetical protein
MATAQPVNYYNPVEVRERGLEALNRELGTVGTIYFMRQFSTGKGDYTQKRKTLLADVTTEDLLHDIDAIENSDLRIFPPICYTK